MSSKIKLTYGSEYTNRKAIQSAQKNAGYIKPENRVYEVQLDNGQTVGNITWWGKKAIESDDIDTYKPRNEKERTSIEKYKSYRDRAREKAKKQNNPVYERYNIDPDTFDEDDLRKWAEEHNFNYYPLSDGPSQFYPKFEGGFLGTNIGAKKLTTKQEEEDLVTLENLITEKRNKKYAEKAPILTSIASYPLNLIGGITGVVETADSIYESVTGREGLPDYTGLSVAASTIRETVTDKYASKWFGGAEGKFGNYGSLLYNGLMSMGDSALSAYTGFGAAKLLGGAGVIGTSAKAIAKTASKITSALMSSSATASAISQNKKRGLSDAKATALGVASGLAEYITEKYSLDAIFKAPKNIISGALKSFVAEGSEEMGSNVINYIADLMIGQDDSELKQTYKNYISSGMTENKAMLKTLEDCIYETLSAGIVGGLSGVAMSGVYHGTGSVSKANEAGNNIKKAKAVDSVVSVGLEYDKNSKIYKSAQKINEARSTNKDISDFQIGKLYNSIANDIQKNYQNNSKEIIQSYDGFSPTHYNTKADEHVSIIQTEEGFYAAKNSSGQIVEITKNELNKNYEQLTQEELNEYILNTSVNNELNRRINSAYTSNAYKSGNNNESKQVLNGVPGSSRPTTQVGQTGREEGNGHIEYSNELSNGNILTPSVLNRNIAGKFASAAGVKPSSAFSAAFLGTTEKMSSSETGVADRSVVQNWAQSYVNALKEAGSAGYTAVAAKTDNLAGAILEHSLGIGSGFTQNLKNDPSFLKMSQSFSNAVESALKSNIRYRQQLGFNSVSAQEQLSAMLNGDFSSVGGGIAGDFVTGISESEKITLDMSDDARAELLNKKSVDVVSVDTGNTKTLDNIDLEALQNSYPSYARPIIKKIARDFGILNEPFFNPDIELEFSYSGDSIQESINKQHSRYGDFVKMLSVFSDVIENAVGVETHKDKYTGTRREDTNLKQMYVLASAFSDEKGIYPVKLEVKEFKKNINKLYLSVVLTKKESRYLSGNLGQNQLNTAPPTPTISIADLVGIVNPSEGDFLKYFPDSMLDTEQIEGKREALAKDAERVENLKAPMKNHPEGDIMKTDSGVSLPEAFKRDENGKIRFNQMSIDYTNNQYREESFNTLIQGGTDTENLKGGIVGKYGIHKKNNGYFGVNLLSSGMDIAAFESFDDALKFAAYTNENVSFNDASYTKNAEGQLTIEATPEFMQYGEQIRAIKNEKAYLQTEIAVDESVTENAEKIALKNENSSDIIDEVENKQGVKGNGFTGEYDDSRGISGEVTEEKRGIGRGNQRKSVDTTQDTARRKRRIDSVNSRKNGSEKAEKGLIRGVFHGSKYKFIHFEKSYVDIGIHFGTEEQAKSRIEKWEGNIEEYDLIIHNPLYCEDIFGERTPDEYVNDLIANSELKENEIATLKEAYKNYINSDIAREAEKSLKTKISSGLYHIESELDEEGIFVSISLTDDEGNINHIPLNELIDKETLNKVFGNEIVEKLLNGDNIPDFAKEKISSLLFGSASIIEINFLKLRKIEEILQSFGYDGFAYKNENEGDGWSYAVFDDSQIIKAGNGVPGSPRPTTQGDQTERVKQTDFGYELEGLPEGSIIDEIAKEAADGGVITLKGNNNLEEAILIYDEGVSEEQIKADITGYYQRNIMPEIAYSNDLPWEDVRFSIENIVGDKQSYGKGVYLDTDIFDGVKPRNWNKILAEFVYNNLAGKSIEIFNSDGTAETINFAKTNERVKKDDANNSHKVIDKLARTKGNINSLAIVHIDELLQTSKEFDETKDNSHQWLDENGWKYRIAYLIDKKGQIYETTLNIAKARDGRNILYALSNTKKVDDGVVFSTSKEEELAHNVQLSLQTISQNDKVVNSSVRKNSKNDTKLPQSPIGDSSLPEGALDSESEVNRNENSRNSLLSGNVEGRVGESAGEQSGRISERPRASEEDGGRRQRNSRTQEFHTEDVRANGGTEVKRRGFLQCEFVKEDYYTDEMNAIATENAKKGITTHFFVGNGKHILKKGLSFRGAVRGNEIFIQCDNARYSPTQINKHELVHHGYNTEAIQKIRKYIKSELTEEERQRIYDVLYANYRTSTKGDIEAIFEEFVCDVLAGMNDYAVRFENVANEYWSGADAGIDIYSPAEYTESIDAGGEDYSFSKGRIYEKWIYNVLNDENLVVLESSLHNISYVQSKYFPKSSDGEFIIESSNVLIYTNGDFENPRVSKIIIINSEYETEIDDIRRQIYEVEKGKSTFEMATRIIENSYGYGCTSVITGENYRANEEIGREIQGENGREVTRTRSKASRKREYNQRFREASRKGLKEITKLMNSKMRYSFSENEGGTDYLTEPIEQIKDDIKEVRLRAEAREGKVYTTSDVRQVCSSILENIDTGTGKGLSMSTGNKAAMMVLANRVLNSTESEKARHIKRISAFIAQKATVYDISDDYDYAGDLRELRSYLTHSVELTAEDKAVLDRMGASGYKSLFGGGNVGIDVIYSELSERRPDLFPDNIYATDAKLERIVEMYDFFKNGAADSSARLIDVLKADDRKIFADAVEGQISRAFSDEELGRESKLTLAVKADVERLEEKHRKEIEQLRERYEKKIASMKKAAQTKNKKSLAEKGLKPKEKVRFESFKDATEKFGRIKQGENPVRDVEVPKQIDEKRYVSRFARTMLEAGITPDDSVSEFEKAILDGTMTHEVITNKKAGNWAKQQIKYLGFEEALNRWTVLSETGKIGKNELALGMELYNQCITNKDVHNAMKIAAELVSEATRAGQTLQACRMLKLMTPDGQLYYLEKSIQKMNEEFRNKLGDKYKDIELDEKLMEEYLSEKDEERRNIVYDNLCQNIADQIPATMLDKWNSWRYLAMLGNPRTHIRNIVGNAIFIPAVRAKNYVGAVIEKTAKVSYTERTKSMRKSKNAVEFAKKDFDAMAKVLQGENAKYAVTSDIEGKRTIFKTKWLEKLRLKNFDFLEKEDMLFLKMHYVDALARLITVRNIDTRSVTPETLTTLRAYAVKEAQAATYRDANALAEGLNKLQRKLEHSDKKAVRATSVLLEGVMPFKKTPMNIAKQGINYSPIGILKGTYKMFKKLKDGNVTADDVIDDFAKGLTGTGVMLLGLWLASLGMLIGAGDKPQKEKEFDKMVGEQSYAFKVKDAFSYTIDWMTPSNLSLFIGAKLYDLTKDDFSFADIVDALSTVTEPLLELSVFSGVNGVIESAQYSDSEALLAIGSDMITSYMLQALPTIGGQLSRIIDENKREYYFVDKNSDVPKGLQRFIGQASSKIPFASYLFEPAIDEWGREEKYGNVLERAFENTVSPGYYAEDNYTEVDKELRELYERTGESSVLPVIQQKYYKQDKIYYYMSAKDYTQVKKMRGKRSFELISNLLDNKIVLKNQEKKFSSMTDEEKVNAVKKCYEQAGKETKEKMLEKVKKKAM